MKQNSIKYLKYSPYYASGSETDDSEWEEFNEAFESLPPPQKDFLVSTETAEFIESLVINNGFNEIQGQTLAAIVRGLIIGNITPSELPKIIEQRLTVGQETSALINAAISNKLTGQSSSKAPPQEPPLSLHEQNVSNLVDLRNKK